MDTAINMDAYVQDNKTEEAYVQMSGTYVNSKRLGIGVCPQKGEPAPEFLRFARAVAVSLTGGCVGAGVSAAAVPALRPGLVRPAGVDARQCALSPSFPPSASLRFCDTALRGRHQQW